MPQINYRNPLLLNEAALFGNFYKPIVGESIFTVKSFK